MEFWRPLTFLIHSPYPPSFLTFLTPSLVSLEKRFYSSLVIRFHTFVFALYAVSDLCGEMRHCTIRRALAVLGLVTLGASDCISTGDDTTINNALKAGGDGAVVQICPNTTITIKNSIVFTADNQELSTWNYPTDDSRAIILLEQTSPNVTALIEGGARNGARLLNIQIDGDREHNGIVNVGMGNAPWVWCAYTDLALSR